MHGREVYIEPVAATEKVNGVYLPSSLQDKERDNTGVVVKAGQGSESEPMEYKVGDLVKFNPHNGRGVNIHDKDLIVVPDTDIYCVIEKSTLI